VGHDQLLGDLEELWARFDTVFDGLSATDWRRKHGKDWVIADLPYHLYYFDRDLVLASIRRGYNVDRQVIAETPRNMGQLNGWNARRFAERRADETPEESLARWREVRTEIRRELLAVRDLDAAWFVPLMGLGWTSGRTALAANIGHHWNHFTQLRLYLGLPGPLESASVRHTALACYMGFVQQMARADVVSRPFTVTMEFTGFGGGAFSFGVAEGRCTLTEGAAPHADLVMTQSPETFVKTFARMQHPMLAMLLGQIKIRGLRHMNTFGKLMPPETDDLAMPVNDIRPARIAA
jgi:hypothetical protein